MLFKTFLKTDLTDCHIYIYETVVHVQINYSGIRCDISSLTNTEAPIYGMFRTTIEILVILWGCQELAQIWWINISNILACLWLYTWKQALKSLYTWAKVLKHWKISMVFDTSAISERHLILNYSCQVLINWKYSNV